MQAYYRPIVQQDGCRPAHAVALAGGRLWFEYAERLSRGAPAQRVTASDIPADILENLTAVRAPIFEMDPARPRIMAVLNATPDSFSDGGKHFALGNAILAAENMIAAGADILDIGGESTRPGADPVSLDQELSRVIPIITTLRARGVTTPISIDTRNAAVARAAIAAGATLFNDVSALSHDPLSISLAATLGTPVCLMHAAGDPKTMQANPRYDDVLLDIYDYLAARIRTATQAGIARTAILVDPGIGFGKTMAHNLALIRGVSLFHGLGCPILLGVSRKGFIGAIGGATTPAARMPGSLAVGLAGLSQGVQILRVHDVDETRQAVALWCAMLPELERR